MSKESYISGFVKAAEASGVNPAELLKAAYAYGIEHGSDEAHYLRRFMNDLEGKGRIGSTPTDAQWKKMISQAKQLGMTDDLLRDAIKFQAYDAFNRRRKGEGFFGGLWRMWKNRHSYGSAMKSDPSMMLKALNDPRNAKFRAFFYDKMRDRMNKSFADMSIDRLPPEARAKVDPNFKVPAQGGRKLNNVPYTGARPGWSSYYGW